MIPAHEIMNPLIVESRNNLDITPQHEAAVPLHPTALTHSIHVRSAHKGRQISHFHPVLSTDALPERL